MKHSTILRPAAACAAAIVLAACASSGSSSTSGTASTSGGPVTYGVLSCFTGRLASLGQAMLQGSQVAMAEINAAGGVLGRKVALVTGDTSCDVADGVTATNQMLTKNISGVIGPETQEINGVEPILDANHIVDEFQGGDTARDHQTDRDELGTGHQSAKDLATAGIAAQELQEKSREAVQEHVGSDYLAIKFLTPEEPG